MTEFSYQLYSSRNFPSRPGTLKMLAGFGYKDTEGYGGMYPDVAAAKKLKTELDVAGLTMKTGHYGMPMLEETPELAIEVAKILGTQTIYMPHIQPDDRPADDAGWAKYGARLEAVAQKLAAGGIKFGYHNHAFELVPTASGATPMALLLDNAPSMSWEMDVAWVVRGEADPLDWIERYKDRISAVHLKDIAPSGECADEDGWADVGHGTMDWTALSAAFSSKTNAKYHVMEHDNPNDENRFAERAIRAAEKF